MNLTKNQHTPSTLIGYEILPQETDPQIDDWFEPHYVVINKSRPFQNRLFLFFSGSYGHCGNQRLIIQQAAKLGYHAINLRYPNTQTIGGLCRLSNNLDCHEQARQAIIHGSHPTNDIQISRANSITNRLVKLLIYLYEKHPEDSWLQYLQGLTINWDSIILAGHSQGGGHAAMIAKNNRVARVIMFSAPSDYSKTRQTPAPWLLKDSATPTNRYYGFAHAQENGIERIVQAWQLLGMNNYGAVVNIDHQPFPYHNAHQLVTNVQIKQLKKRHGSVVVDAVTPKHKNGQPLFHEVWSYLICEES